MSEKYELAAVVIDELKNLIDAQNIVIYNNSDQLIKAWVSATGADVFVGSTEVFKIYPGSSEKWTRLRQEVVRICAFSLWHDFQVSQGAVIRLTKDFQLQIVDGDNSFGWDATQDGPDIP